MTTYRVSFLFLVKVVLLMQTPHAHARHLCGLQQALKLVNVILDCSAAALSVVSKAFTVLRDQTEHTHKACGAARG